MPSSICFRFLSSVVRQESNSELKLEQDPVQPVRFLGQTVSHVDVELLIAF